MRNNEVVAEIRKLDKPYEALGIPQPTFSNTLKLIEKGLSKPKTIKKFFALFGYSGDYNNFHYNPKADNICNPCKEHNL